MRRALLIGRGVGALFATLLLVFGVPAALATGVGWPLPRVLPSWEEFSATLDGTLPLDPALVWKIMAIAVWVAWAQLTIALVMEIVAVAKGGLAHQVTGLGAMQRMASGLIGSILFIIPTTPAIAAPVATLDDARAMAVSAESHTVEVDLSDPVVIGGTDMDHRVEAAPELEHVVERRDTLWGLAEQYLAPDGTPEEISAAVQVIFEANKGKTQADGGAMVDAGLLRTGWVLTIPGATQPADADGPATSVEDAGPGGEVVVERGDTMWGIAEEHLGEGQRYTEIMEINEGQSHVGGDLVDASLIHPGWVLQLPGDASVEPIAESEPEVVAELPPPVDPEPEPEPVVEPPLVDRPTSMPAAAAAPERVLDTAGSDSLIDEFDQSSLQPVGLIGGGMTTAGLLFLLDRRRRARQRCLLRGERLPAPGPALQQAELELRAGASPVGASLVDVALRAAAAGAGSTGLGALSFVEADDTSVVLVFDEPAPAPKGFRSLDARRWESVVGVDELAELGRRATAPAPALCPVGTTNSGTEILIDLEASAVLAVDGPPARVAGFLRAMATAVATARWAEQPRVVLVGMTGELTSMPSVEAVPTLGDALRVASGRIAETETLLQSLACSSTAQARAVGETPDAWEPLVVISGAPMIDADAAALRSVVDRPRHTVAVVAPGVGIPGRAAQITDDGRLRIDGLDRDVWARQLDERDTQVVADLLIDAATAESVVVADLPTLDLRTSPVLPVPAVVTDDNLDAPIVISNQAAEAVLGSLLAEVDVLVRLLGDVQVNRRASGGEEPLVTGKVKATEAVAYLALRESSVSREDVQAALWPAGETTTKTFNNVISAARSSLAESREGLPLLPPASGGQYLMSDRVVTDFGLFYELVQRAGALDDEAQSAELLAQALSLVMGEPFLGAGRSYAWVAPHSGMIISQVIDTAEELAEFRLECGDWRGAEWAARQGLRAMPSDERMYRLLMRTAHAAGSVPGVHRAFRELCDAVADPDFGTEPEDTVHPETMALLQELTGRSVADRATA